MKRGPRHRRITRLHLHKAMFVLPNLFTLAGIFCGFYAILTATCSAEPQALVQASLAIFFGVFFDTVDGRVARMTRTQSEFGTQMDSLADVITFGVAPAVIIYQWALHHLHGFGMMLAFMYVACGAMRLARFNVLAMRAVATSKKYFTGTPIPMPAGVIGALVIYHQRMYPQANDAVSSVHAWMPYIVILLVVLSYLMISNIRYRTFKDMPLNKHSLMMLCAGAALFIGLSIYSQPVLALLVFAMIYVVDGLIDKIMLTRRLYQEKNKLK